MFFLNGEAIKIIKPNQLFKLGKRYNTLTQEMRSVETFFVEGFQLINSYFLILKYLHVLIKDLIILFLVRFASMAVL